MSVSNLSDNFLILHVTCDDIKQKVELLTDWWSLPFLEHPSHQQTPDQIRNITSTLVQGLGMIKSPYLTTEQLPPFVLSGGSGSAVRLPVWGPDKAVRYCQQAELHTSGPGQVQNLEFRRNYSFESHKSRKKNEPNSVWNCYCHLQCAIWHPARQGGVCGLQEWSGVHGLQGKEWPFDGGECGVHQRITFTQFKMTIRTKILTKLFTFF